MRRLALVLTLLVTSPLLVAFRPFTPAQSVCPNCSEKGDKVIFPDGKILVCDVIAKNQDGYVLQKFGELRFVQFQEIAKIEFAAGAEPKGLDNYDQILIKNKEQTVLHGTLIEVEAGKPLALRSPRGQVYQVMAPQIVVYYQRGARKAPPMAVQN
jgi:hypothetical protein